MKLTIRNNSPIVLRKIGTKRRNDYIMTNMVISIMEENKKRIGHIKKYLNQANIEQVKADEKGNISIGNKIIK